MVLDPAVAHLELQFCEITVLDFSGADKFGNLQQCNDKIPDADIERVSTIAEESAEMLETDVYGGDLIVTEEGTLYLVDFNDWPSFGCCQDKAAKVIAELILNRI